MNYCNSGSFNVISIMMITVASKTVAFLSANLYSQVKIKLNRVRTCKNETKL